MRKQIVRQTGEGVGTTEPVYTCIGKFGFTIEKVIAKSKALLG